MCFKRLVFASGLQLLLAGKALEVFAAEPVIISPDGPRGIEPQKAPREPSHNLKRWLERRRREREEEKGAGENPSSTDSAEDAGSGTGKDKAKEKEKERERERQKPSLATLRLDLDLNLPHLVPLGSRAARWTSEPSPALRIWGRLSDEAPAEAASFWLGFRLFALSGSGRVQDKTARFAWTYFGPAVAWEWLGRSSSDSSSEADDILADEASEEGGRHRLGLGWTLVSRQGEVGLGDLPRELATRSIGIDGPGLCLEYSYGSSWNVKSEWQLTTGLQVLSEKALVYLGFGLSLWSAGS